MCIGRHQQGWIKLTRQMLVLSPGQQGVQSMAKLMDQCCGIVVTQQTVRLLKVAGQSNDGSLVLAVGKLATTA